MAEVDPSNRKAYLEEQVERQKRGEPIDVEWVRNELDRVRREQAEVISNTQRRLRYLVVAGAALLLVLWYQNGGMSSPGGWLILLLVVVGVVAAIRFAPKR
jgi:hypothetical protein